MFRRKNVRTQLTQKRSYIIDVGRMIVCSRSGRSSGASLVGAAEAEDLPEDVGEGVFEVTVRHDVDHRVQGGVEVADPEEN